MKPTHYIFSILLVLTGAAAAYFLVPAYADYQHANKEKKQLEQERTALSTESQALESMIHDLRTNPRAVERVAREKFGWCRDNEKIYHFDVAAPAGQDD